MNRSLQLFSPNFKRVFAATAALIVATAINSQAQLNNEPFLPSPVQTASTVPANGDVNPYGVAFVPAFFQGTNLTTGDLLISNFNSNQNLQGTGTTIVRIQPNGTKSTFFQGTAPLGLSTALGVLRKGLVVVGNLPTLDGTPATAGPGSLLVLNGNGTLLQNISGPAINGPWDATFNDQGGNVQIFVSNALNGTIVRFDATAGANGLTIHKTTQIASGYQHRGDPVALFVAPTGLVYDSALDVLYIASTDDNEIFAVGHAGARTSDSGPGRVVYQDTVHLHGPLGMVRTPNGHLLVANSDVINPDPNQPSEIVEFTTYGQFVKEISVDPLPGGSFGLGIFLVNSETAKFAAVDDNQSSVNIWTLPL